MSVVTDGAGETSGAEATGEVAAMTGEVDAAGDFAGAADGTGGGGFCAITGGTVELAGAGVGVTFLFFASFPPFGVAAGFSAGAGDTAATFGASIC